MSACCRGPGGVCVRVCVWDVSTVFALRNVAALIASLGVRGVAPRADAISVWIPAVVQLQAVGGCRSPPETNRILWTTRTFRGLVPTLRNGILTLTQTSLSLISPESAHLTCDRAETWTTTAGR